MFDSSDSSDYISASDENDERNDTFKCDICDESFEMSEMISLNCKHLCCLLCFQDHVSGNLDVTVVCPIFDCKEKLTDFEIRQVLSEEDILKYERMSFKNIPNMYTCMSPDCGSMVWSDGGNDGFTCNNCFLENCIKCSVPHSGMTCENFKKLSQKNSEAIIKTEFDKAQKILMEKARASFTKANQADLVINDCIFPCYFCGLIIAKNKGVKLRACFHPICRECLKHSILTTAIIPPKCQYDECQGILEDREIYGILSNEEVESYERKSFTRIKLKLTTPFQCKQANCDFFCELVNKNADHIICNKCKSKNCLKCQAVHNKESCKAYQNRLKNSDVGRNEELIQESIARGECMKCPDCKNLVKKGRGCNWIQCSNCGLELCWVLKMRRWGPKVLI